MTAKTQAQMYQIYKVEVQANNGELTDFNPGSMHDIIAGAFSLAVNESQQLTLLEFMKTFFDTAEGTEAQGGSGDVDNLEKLAVDHFGERFARPGAAPATVEVNFSRANDTAGDVPITIGDIVKTEKDANGEEVRFKVLADVILVGLSVDLDVEAVVPGVGGNVDPTLIKVIETSLVDDSLVVTNAEKAAGGVEAEDDSEYRETIRALIDTLAGATEAAIKGAILAVAGIEFAVLVNTIIAVKEWDIGENEAIGDYFYIPYAVVYITDEDGNSSPALIQLAQDAIDPDVKAAGVKITVKGGSSGETDWDGSITLNPEGPNYAELVSDPQPILDTMASYINDSLDIGKGFDRIVARAHILSIWGEDGTDDLDDFVNNVPVGNISGVAGIKLIAGTMSVS